ncbi:unnamed protein product [Chrysoparadoxa australica]
MSRSALERVVQRRVQAGAPAGQASVFDPSLNLGGDDENRYVKREELPMHGNNRTYNLNSLLAANIVNSEYFRSLVPMTTYQEIVDEVYTRCSHCAPWATGTSRIPSSLFCLLLKAFSLRFTKNQMNQLLVHEDSPYIRTLGFLYLRYSCPPKELWGWFVDYIDDPEEFKPTPDSPVMTMGQYVQKLITDMQYYGTMLPRIPVPIERSMKVQLLLHGEKKKRAIVNRAVQDRLVVGTKIRAIYADADNDPAWYDAVIQSVEADDMFYVSFPEYGNVELLGLGEVQLLESTDRSQSKSQSRGRDQERQRSESKGRDKRRDSRERDRDRDRDRRRDGHRDRDRDGRRRRSRSRDRDRDRDRRRGRSRSRSRGRDRDRDRRRKRSRSGSASGRRSKGGAGDPSVSVLDMDPNKLYQQVLENERRGVTAVGKDYASRPASFKGSMSLKLDRYTHRQKSRSRSPVREVIDRRTRPRSRSRDRNRRKRSPERKPEPVSAEQLAKQAQLRKKYGDASSKR